MQEINANIGDGGKVIPVYASDKGRTSIVEYRPTPEKAHERLNREMTNRARSFYPNPRESALERNLFNQIAGKQVLSDNTISADLETRFHAWQADLIQARSNTESLERELFNQVANHGKAV